MYIVRSIDLSMTPLSMRYCSANSPEMSALASSMALQVSCSACRGVVARPPTMMLCGPSPCISSCIRMCVKNGSKATFF